MFERAKVLLPLVLLTGCLTPEMGQRLERTLGLTWEPVTARRAETVFDQDLALPDRIWYGDLVAGIYHERRTNTYLAFDLVHQGWGAVPQEEAFARGFRPARARLLPTGPPDEVKNVVDYLTAMEPGWRGG